MTNPKRVMRVIGMMPQTMARILIVGCGGRGQALARELVAAGPRRARDDARPAALRRRSRRRAPSPTSATPTAIMTLMDALAATTIVGWLMGSATGDDEQVRELHGGRLRMLCEKVVDTPVRGLVYEAAGTVAVEWLEEGEMIARAARATWNIPLEVLDTDPADCDGVDARRPREAVARPTQASVAARRARAGRRRCAPSRPRSGPRRRGRCPCGTATPRRTRRRRA